jgi:hypothetical protein
MNNNYVYKSGRDILEPSVVGVITNGGKSFYQRRYFKPKIESRHVNFGIKHKAAVELWKATSEEFKIDCREYARLYNEQHLEEGRGILRCINVFLMVLNGYDKVFSSIEELKAEIGGDLNTWIRGGYLRRVKTGYSFEGEVG